MAALRDCIYGLAVVGTMACALSQGHGRAGECDNGNGSLMRIVPLAFTDATDGDIRAVSAITRARDLMRRLRATCSCREGAH